MLFRSQRERHGVDQRSGLQHADELVAGRALSHSTYATSLLPVSESVGSHCKGGKCFWEYGFGWNLYYWLIALAFCLIGMSCFKKLKQHFADVL